MIPFGKWEPDSYDLNSPQAGEASGVLPGRNSYHPWPSLSAYSAALGDYARGAYLARSSTGSYIIYAGLDDGLFRFTDVSTWTDYSGTTYNLPTDERWSATQFGSLVIFGNRSDPLQKVDVDSGTQFEDLGGSPPSASIVRTVGDFVMLGDLENLRNGVHWSGLNNAEFWTLGQRSCDRREFPEGGFVTGITQLETGLIFQEYAVRRFTQVPDNAVFAFARVEDAQGCIARDSIAVVKGTAYYLARSGFCKIGPDTGYVSIPIGLGINDTWFRDSIEPTRLYAIQAMIDPLHPRIFFLAPSSGNTTAVLDILLCYDIVFDRWTHTTVSASMLFAAATAGYTLEGLDALYPDLDAMPVSLDSPTLQGGIPYPAAFDGDKKLSFFNGSSQAAVLRTGEFQAVPGKRAVILGHRPIGDPVNISGRVATRENPQGSASWGSSSSVDARGMIPVRASGRYHRIEHTVEAGESWTHMQGVEFAPNDIQQDGAR